MLQGNNTEFPTENGCSLKVSGNLKWAAAGGQNFNTAIANTIIVIYKRATFLHHHDCPG